MDPGIAKEFVDDTILAMMWGDDTKGFIVPWGYTHREKACFKVDEGNPFEASKINGTLGSTFCPDDTGGAFQQQVQCGGYYREDFVPIGQFMLECITRGGLHQFVFEKFSGAEYHGGS